MWLLFVYFVFVDGCLLGGVFLGEFWGLLFVLVFVCVCGLFFCCFLLFLLLFFVVVVCLFFGVFFFFFFF